MLQNVEFSFLTIMLKLMILGSLLASVASDWHETKRFKTGSVLILGGSGQVSASAVRKFVDFGYTVSTVRRGYKYWDSEERIPDHVTTYECDRKKGLRKCSVFMKGFLEVQYYDIVVDFSSKTQELMQDIVELLKTPSQATDATPDVRVGLYIYVSGSSVYDVCTKKHEGLTKENDAVRPSSADEREEMNKYHPDGDARLEAEEILYNQRLDGGFPFVILRLPDIVGPRDTTARWWLYHLWVRLAAADPMRPIQTPEFLSQYAISLVYSEDVADIIANMTRLGPQIEDQAINLAYPDVFYIEQILDDIRIDLGIDYTPMMAEPMYEYDDYNDTEAGDNTTDKTPLYMYPTVRSGPLDVSKAVSLLGWETTPWLKAIHSMVEFYESAMRDERYARERLHVIHVLAERVYSDNKALLYDTLNKLYDIDMQSIIGNGSRDEL